MASLNLKSGPPFSAVNGRLAVELERHRHDRARRAPVNLMAGLAVATHGDDARVVEDAAVKAGSFLRLLVKP